MQNLRIILCESSRRILGMLPWISLIAIDFLCTQRIIAICLFILTSFVVVVVVVLRFRFFFQFHNLLAEWRQRRKKAKRSENGRGWREEKEKKKKRRGKTRCNEKFSFLYLRQTSTSRESQCEDWRWYGRKWVWIRGKTLTKWRMKNEKSISICSFSHGFFLLLCFECSGLSCFLFVLFHLFR